MRRPPSGSQLGRAIICVPSSVLPEVRSVSRETENEAANRGKELHQFLFNVLLYGRENALRHVPPEYLTDCEAIDTEKLPAAAQLSFQGELGLAYNFRTDTARSLGSGLNRDYSGVDDTCEIAGTPDAIGLADDHVVVWDYKTGQKYLGAPKDSWQLKAYALFAARTFKKDKALIGFIRIDEEGTPRFSSDLLEPWDLDEIAEAIHGMMRQREAMISGVILAETYAEGDHCTGCSSFASCPIKTGLSSALGRNQVDLLPVGTRLTPEFAAVAFSRLRLAKQVLEAVEIQLKEYTKEFGAVQLPNGNWWGPGPQKSIEIDPVEARPLLEVGIAVEAVKTQTTLTKEDLAEAHKHVFTRANGGKVRGVGKAFDELLETLTKAGAAKVVTKTVWRERKNAPGSMETKNIPPTQISAGSTTIGVDKSEPHDFEPLPPEDELRGVSSS